MSRLCPPIIDRLRAVARVRVLYADTDKMGIAYHAAYLRYMELGRVELDRIVCDATERVVARWIAEVLGQVRKHRVDDLGKERRRRVVVEVDRLVAHADHASIQGFAR